MTMSSPGIQTAIPTAASQETPSYLGPCAGFSWSPEVFDFYGNPEAVIEKIDGQKLPVTERRMYFLLVESAQGAEMRFFERVSEGLAAVFSWSGESAVELKSRIDRAVLSNRGVNCIGEQLKALIAEGVELNLEGTVPAPATPRAAFAHTIRNNGGDGYVRATTAMLC